MVNYTYSKSIDDLGTFRVGDNNRLDRSLSTADIPQNLVASVVYLLPVGRGHMWGDNPVYRGRCQRLDCLDNLHVITPASRLC